MYALDPSKNTAWRRTCFVCLIPKGGKQGHDNYICCMQIDGFLMQTYWIILYVFHADYGNSFTDTVFVSADPYTMDFSLQGTSLYR